jgi:hypothetical protein
MILLKEIVEEIRNDLNSGMGYNDSRLDDEYIEAKIHAARSTLITNSIIKLGKFINDSFVQTLDLSFVDYEKDCDVVTFECPNVISLDGQNDGFIYVGHVNGFKPFPRLRKGFTTLARHSVFRQKTEVMWDYKHLEQGKMLLQFYNNNKLQYVTVRAIFNNPTTIPNFNKDTDHYPVDANVKKDIVDMITQDLIRKTSRPVEPGNSTMTEIPR